MYGIRFVYYDMMMFVVVVKIIAQSSNGYIFLIFPQIIM